jgi:GAF domain-containing protein
MDNILELKRKNQEIAEKFQEIEEKLSSAGDPVGLFEGWMSGMAEAFGIPFLWISLIQNPENEPLIKVLKSSAILGERLNVVDGTVFAALAPNGVAPVLATGELRPFYRLLPRNKYFIRSLAVAPITLHGRVVGTLNHGDSSPARYAPEMDTSLLQGLASRLSSRLSLLLKEYAPLSPP